jgi:hypothetical protein
MGIQHPVDGALVGCWFNLAVDVSRSLPYLEHTTECLKYEKFRKSLNLKDIKKTRPTQHKDEYPKTLATRVLEN